MSAVALFIRWLIFVSDKLIDYVPADSIAYISSRQSFWFWQTHTADDLPLKDIGWLTAKFADLSSTEFRDKFTSRAHQISLSIVSDDANQLGYLLFLDFAGHKVSADDISQLKYYWQPRSNVLVIGSSQNLIDQVKKISDPSNLSLNNIISHDLFGRSEINLFINAKNLNQYLADKQDRFGYANILTSDLYLSMNKKSEHWVFTGDSLDKTRLLNVDLPLKVLPKNFIFYVSGFELGDIFSDWLKLDAKLAESKNSLASSLMLTVNISPDNIAELFNHPAAAVFAATSTPSILGVDFALVLSDVSGREISIFKDIVVNYLAQKNPKVISRTLPDKTTVKELVLDRAAWSWQLDNSSGHDVYFLIDETLPLEVAYSFDGQSLMIANSHRMLNDIFSGQGIPLPALGRCNQAEPNLILNVANLSEHVVQYLPAGLVMGSDHQGSKVSGCILNN